MKTGYSIRDAMTTKPITIAPETSLDECAKIMDNKHISAIPIKSGGNVLGIITEQDIVRKVVAKGINPLNEKVMAFMEKNMVTISPDADIYDALIKMRDLNIRHLPVIENSQMIGLLTLKDILKIEPQLFDLLVERFNIREETTKPIGIISPKEGICQGCGAYTESLNQVGRSLLCDVCKREQKDI